MRKLSAAIALIQGVVLSPDSATAVPLKPTSTWRVDYETAQCVASREYGSDQKPLTLALKPSPNGGVMRILVLRRGQVDAHEVPAILRFGEISQKTNLLDYSDDQTGLRITAINVPMKEFKEKLQSASIDLESISTPRASFAVSQLADVTGELDKCLIDLQDYWNIGEKYKSRIAADSQAERPLEGLFSPRDYPEISLNLHEEGSVSITFLVDEKGQIRDCSVDATSGIPALDTMACYVVSKRARIAPARDPQGRAIRSAYSKVINWRIR